MKKITLLVFSLLIISTLSTQNTLNDFQKIGRNNLYGKLNTAKINQLETQTNVSKQRLDSVYNLTSGLNLSSKNIYNYDNQGNMIVNYNYQWSGSSWIPVSKYEYNYDDKNRNTSLITYNWEFRRPNSWDVSGKDVYTYNALGLRKTYKSYNIYLTSPDGSTYTFVDSGTHFEYTYNPNNQLVNVSQYNLSSKVESLDFFYDEHGSMTLENSTIFQSDGSLVLQKSAFDNTYNGNTITSTLITTGFIDAAGIWAPGYRAELTFDANGNYVSFIDYYWNPTTGAQSSLQRQVLLYDTNFTINDVLNVPTSEVFSILPVAKNKRKKTSSYSSRTGGSPTSVNNYYYSTVEINTAVQTISSEKVSIYPNPAKDYIQISGIENAKTVLITDLNGRLILTKKLVTNDNIYVGNLAKGMYIVKVISDNKTTEQKIVKE